MAKKSIPQEAFQDAPESDPAQQLFPGDGLQPLPENKEEPITKEKRERQRRKAPTIDEVRTECKLMQLEHRAELIGHLKTDLAEDVSAQHAKEQAALEEQQKRLDRLKNIF